MIHPIKQLLQKRLAGQPVGIYSICSANEYVIEAAMEKALAAGTHVLIESTANQVDQFGGYTGMKPADFREFVYTLAGRVGLPADRVILGGDHLGPLTWKAETAAVAMEKAHELVRQYVLAGFTKIHIDTSMHLGDDDHENKLDPVFVAARGAELCKTAQQAFLERTESFPAALAPVYVVGSEVPTPGGSQEEEEGIQVTKAWSFRQTVETFKAAFYNLGLQEAWQNVIAFVVQPGVEFGDETIHEYNREAARELCSALKDYPALVFEGHSTDYQTEKCLKYMVEDGIAILKVGPALTFALREALLSLCLMEKELFKYDPCIPQSNLIDVLDSAMLKNPANWRKHYHGEGSKVRLAMRYSLSDRCRYYLPMAEVKEAIDILLRNLQSVHIPLTLIDQYMPIQYEKIRNKVLKNDPKELLKDRVVNVLDAYHRAVTPSAASGEMENAG